MHTRVPPRTAPLLSQLTQDEALDAGTRASRARCLLAAQLQPAALLWCVCVSAATELGWAGLGWALST